MRQTERITFIIPAYNASSYLPDAIASIRRAFRCVSDQILVVDDGSRDATFQVTRDAGVRCVRHPSNRGIASTLNTGIALAETEYVAWLSADDLYADEAGDAVEAAMMKNRDADLYFGHYRLLQPDGSITEAPVPSLLEVITPEMMNKDWFVDLLYGCFINGATAIMKRHRVLELGLFDPRHRYAQDYAMWLLMAYHRSSAVYIPDPIGIRRIHEGQLSHRFGVQQAIRREDAALLRHYLDRGGLERLAARIEGAEGDPDIPRAIFIKKLLRVGLISHALQVLKTSSSMTRLGVLVGSELSKTVYKRIRKP